MKWRMRANYFKTQTSDLAAQAPLFFGRAWRWIAYSLIAAGIFLRLYHYIDNRSLWEDELFLASSLIRMNFAELAIGPLDYCQRAPLGFLWAVKASVALFGNQEMALRLFSLLCGGASLFVTIPVARHFLGLVGSLVALSIVALAPPLIYHSVEVKQYGTEFLASMLALWLYVRFHNEKDWRSLTLWGLGGAVIIWFSFTSLFVLAGIGGYCVWQRFRKKEGKKFFLSITPFVIWAGSFGLYYLLIISQYPEERWLTDFWERRAGFFPLPPDFIAEIKWLLHYVYSFVYYPLGLTWIEADYTKGYDSVQRMWMRMPFLPILMFVLGSIVMALQQPKQFFMLAMILAIAVVASALRLYPLHERLNVFLAPVGILFVARACDWLYNWRRNFGLCVVFVLLAAPITNSAWAVLDTNKFGGYKKSYQREALLYIKEQYQPGDLVYIYWNDEPGWNYYSKAYQLDFKAIEGMDVRHTAHNFPDYYQKMNADMEAIRQHRRVWVVYRRFNGMKPGDFEGQPQWYYDDKVNAVGKLHELISGFGTEMQAFRPANVAFLDVYAGLFLIR